MTVRDVLTIGTIGGATALALQNKIGTLTPGKEADIVLIRGNDITNGPVNNAIGTVVIGATPDSVDTVIIAGQGQEVQRQTGGGRRSRGHAGLARVAGLSGRRLRALETAGHPRVRLEARGQSRVPASRGTRRLPDRSERAVGRALEAYTETSRKSIERSRNSTHGSVAAKERFSHARSEHPSVPTRRPPRGRRARHVCAGAEQPPAPLTSRQLKPNVWEVEGGGGNSTVVVGTNGVIVVDAKTTGRSGEAARGGSRQDHAEADHDRLPDPQRRRSRERPGRISRRREDHRAREQQEGTGNRARRRRPRRAAGGPPAAQVDDEGRERR